jgi:hypothetical protein
MLPLLEEFRHLNKSGCLLDLTLPQFTFSSNLRTVESTKPFQHLPGLEEREVSLPSFPSLKSSALGATSVLQTFLKVQVSGEKLQHTAGSNFNVKVKE